MRLILLTGTSGAGKMTALQYFDDIGYYAVDNVPPALLPELARACQADGRDRVVAVVDARAGASLARTPEILDRLSAEGGRLEILYLDASDDTLVRRFKETRRPHPVFCEGRGTILDAIRIEREMLNEMRARADKVIDTTSLAPAGLAVALADITGERIGPKLQITVTSFGFKHGLPIDADLVFDVRFLVNPHYVAKLKPMTGLDAAVARYIHQDSLTEPFLEKMFDFVGFSLPQYHREGKAYLNVAVGCTGGRHRSVTIAEDLAAYLRREGYRVVVRHRDVKSEESEQRDVAPEAAR